MSNVQSRPQDIVEVRLKNFFMIRRFLFFTFFIATQVRLFYNQNYLAVATWDNILASCSFVKENQN